MLFVLEAAIATEEQISVRSGCKSLLDPADPHLPEAKQCSMIVPRFGGHLYRSVERKRCLDDEDEAGVFSRVRARGGCASRECGRPLMQVATEVGISPSMLRNWRAAIHTDAARSRAVAAGVPPDSNALTCRAAHADRRDNRPVPCLKPNRSRVTRPPASAAALAR